MSVLRRRVIIRQYDYLKLAHEAIPGLYDASSFVPITLKELEQEHLMMVLSEKPSEKLLVPRNYQSDEKYYEYPQNYLWHMQNRLYDKKYVGWFSEYDEDGYLWIQARKNTPRTLLGWGEFEYYY
jgi:carotenoid cleavage dioxygenase-like enzyme